MNLYPRFKDLKLTVPFPLERLGAQLTLLWNLRDLLGKALEYRHQHPTAPEVGEV